MALTWKLLAAGLAIVVLAAAASLGFACYLESQGKEIKVASFACPLNKAEANGE